LPLESGLTVGSSSTFLSEFFLIRLGFLSLLVSSVYAVIASASSSSNMTVVS
jgi:hypothetical protein